MEKRVWERTWGWECRRVRIQSSMWVQHHGDSQGDEHPVCIRRNWSSRRIWETGKIMGLNFILMAIGIRQDQRNGWPSRSKTYPRKREIMCLSNTLFKLFLLQMASSPSTAITLAALAHDRTSGIKHEKTCTATSSATSHPVILTCRLSQLLFCFHQVTKNISGDSTMMNKQESIEW